MDPAWQAGEPALLSQVYYSDSPVDYLEEIEENEQDSSLAASSSTTVGSLRSPMPDSPIVPFTPGPNDCKEGRCWYTREFLKDQGRLIQQELHVLAQNEFEEWEREFDSRAQFFDDVAWRGMCKKGFGLPMPGPTDPLLCLRRCSDYQRQQDTVRQFQKQQKKMELQLRQRQALNWWLDKSECPKTCRRLEQGLCGLNPRGRGKGAGGAR